MKLAVLFLTVFCLSTGVLVADQNYLDLTRPDFCRSFPGMCSSASESFEPEVINLGPIPNSFTPKRNRLAADGPRVYLLSATYSGSIKPSAASATLINQDSAYRRNSAVYLNIVVANMENKSEAVDISIDITGAKNIRYKGRKTIQPRSLLLFSLRRTLANSPSVYSITANIGQPLPSNVLDTASSKFIIANVGTGSACGNGACEAGESRQSCPQDCGGSTQPVCGNNRCEQGETRNNCPQDCSSNSPVCGNNRCEEGEDRRSCPQDCTPSPVCGNDRCEDGETENNCPDDCAEEPPPSNCHSCYTGPGVCVPANSGDVDCGEIPWRNFNACPSDPYNLDGNDNDGIACES